MHAGASRRIIPVQPGLLQVLLAAAVCAAAVLPVLAQRPPQVSQLQMMTPKVPVVRVVPSAGAQDLQHRLAQLGVPPAQLRSLPSATVTARPVPPLSWSDRRAALLGSNIKVPSTPPREFTLSVREPFRPDGAALVFVNPTVIAPNSNMALGGLVGVTFRTERAARFLIDASVAAFGTPARFVLAAENAKTTVDLATEQGHVLAVFEAGGSGTLTVSLAREDGSWIFQNVVVTRLE